jgi:hypothetical protein
MTTKKLKFRTQFDKTFSPTGETNNEPSKTKPDEALTLQQLLNNHVRGINRVEPKPGIYTESEVIPKEMDLVDIDERRKQLAKRQTDLLEQIEQETLEKANKASESTKNSPSEQDPSKE